MGSLVGHVRFICDTFAKDYHFSEERLWLAYLLFLSSAQRVICQWRANAYNNLIIQMSRRIFAAAQSDSKTVPNCYYHKLAITHFCTKKKCTLPLCAECLPLHKKQHIKDKQIAMEGIAEFQTARSDCLSAFALRKAEIEAVQLKFKQKVMEYRKAIVQIVDKVVDRFYEDCLITDGNLQILKEIQERTSQIRSGSLKELIRYYEDIYGAQHFRKLYKMYTGQYLNRFAFEVDQKKTEEIVSAGLINSALEEPAVGTKKQSERFSLEASQYKEQSPAPINIYHNSQQLNAVKHVSTEQESESDISSYTLIKSKKGNTPNNSHTLAPQNQGRTPQNIYTQPNSKIQERVSRLPFSNTSQVSKSRSNKKKGISLVKSQQQLPIHSRQSFKDDEKGGSTERRANWRDFINMGPKKPEQVQGGQEQGRQQAGRQEQGRQQAGRQEAARQQIGAHSRNELDLVLNPSQMRQLLAKKKSEEKYKTKSISLRRQSEILGQNPLKS